MKVIITIKTGNEAMQDERDIAAALREVAHRIEKSGLTSVTKVLDVNGQSVGSVIIEDEDA